MKSMGISQAAVASFEPVMENHLADKNIKLQETRPLHQDNFIFSKYALPHLPNLITSMRLMIQTASAVLSQIARDWSDDPVVKIISHLRESATPEMKLVVVDHVVPYASRAWKST